MLLFHEQRIPSALVNLRNAPVAPDVAFYDIIAFILLLSLVDIAPEVMRLTFGEQFVIVFFRNTILPWFVLFVSFVGSADGVDAGELTFLL
jgi:hypothetical protein